MIRSIRPSVLALLAIAALALNACGVNPVTGKKELQLISQEGEIQIGQQNYAPSRQSQGGDYVLLPELTAYVSEVGQKLAAVSDRRLRVGDHPFSARLRDTFGGRCVPGCGLQSGTGIWTDCRGFQRDHILVLFPLRTDS